MENELLEEGWVKFLRFPCKEGHIDRWMGDCIDNPNKPTRNRMCLNSSATYYRFNDGKWYNGRGFKGILEILVKHIRGLLTADEIFKETYKLDEDKEIDDSVDDSASGDVIT